MVSKRSCEWLLAAPSVPSATLTPWRSISTTGATPSPSIMLLTGLCDTDEPVCFNSPISSFEMWTEWAKIELGPGMPNSCKNSTTPFLPCSRRTHSTTDFDSATCALIPSDFVVGEAADLLE